MLLHWGLRMLDFSSSTKPELSLEKQQAMNINRKMIIELCHVFQFLTYKQYKCSHFFLILTRTPNCCSIRYNGNIDPEHRSSSQWAVLAKPAVLASPGSHRSVQSCVLLVQALNYSWRSPRKWPLEIQSGKNPEASPVFLHTYHVHPIHAQNLLQCLGRATNLEDKDVFPRVQMLAQVNHRRQRNVQCTTARSALQLLRWTRL